MDYENLDRGALVSLNALYQGEIGRVMKESHCKLDCVNCKSGEYCKWLHSAQCSVLNKMNEES